MNIIAGKTYRTRDGRKVHIIYTEANSIYPVIGLIDNKEIVEFTKSGRYYKDYTGDGQDLIEKYSFWEDVEVDTPIYVRKSDNGIWLPRYFAKYENDKIFAWDYGRTSFTSKKGESVFWKYGKLKD